MALRFCAIVRIPAAPMLVLGIALAVGAASAHAQTAGADNSAIYSYQGADRAQRQRRIVQSVCACTAVIATVLTMSVTVHPRERSLTGLRKPCSTGPTATAPAER